MLTGGGQQVVHRRGRTVDALHNDGKGGRIRAALTIGDGVANRGGAGFPFLEVGKGGVGKKGVRAIGLDGEGAVVAAHDQVPHSGRSTGNLGDGEGAAVGVTVIQQQVGIFPGLVGGLAIGHRQLFAFSDAALVIGGHRVLVGGGYRDREGGRSGGFEVVRHCVGDLGGAALVGFQVVEAGAGVKAVSAIGLHGESAAVAARHRGAGAYAADSGDFEAGGGAVRVAVIQQQVRIDAAGAGLAIGHGEGGTAGDGAGIVPGHRRRVDALHHDREGGRGDAAKTISDGVSEGGYGGRAAAGEGVIFAIGVKSVAAIGVDGEQTLAVATRNRPPDIGGAAADMGDGEGVAVGVAVIAKQAVVDRGGGQVAEAVVIRAHRQQPVFPCQAVVVAGDGLLIGAAHRDRQFAIAEAVVAIPHDIADPGSAGLDGFEVVKLAVGVKLPGAILVDRKQAAFGARDRLASVFHKAVDTFKRQGVAVRVAVIGQHARGGGAADGPVLDGLGEFGQDCGGGVYALVGGWVLGAGGAGGFLPGGGAGVVVGVRGGGSVGAGFVRGGFVRVRVRGSVRFGRAAGFVRGAVGVGRAGGVGAGFVRGRGGGIGRGFVSALDDDGDTGGGDAVGAGDGQGIGQGGALLQILNAGLAVGRPIGPGAGCADGEAAVAAADGLRSEGRLARIAAGGAEGAAGQQVAGGVHIFRLVLRYRGAGPGQDGGVIGAGDGDGQGGGCCAAGVGATGVAVDHCVGDFGGGGFVGGEAVKVRARVEGPGAVGGDNEGATVAAANHWHCVHPEGGARQGHIGRSAGDSGDGEGVAFRVPVIGQQAAAGETGSALMGCADHHRVGVFAEV